MVREQEKLQANCSYDAPEENQRYLFDLVEWYIPLLYLSFFLHFIVAYFTPNH